MTDTNTTTVIDCVSQQDHDIAAQNCANPPPFGKGVTVTLPGSSFPMDVCDVAKMAICAPGTSPGEKNRSYVIGALVVVGLAVGAYAIYRGVKR